MIITFVSSIFGLHWCPCLVGTELLLFVVFTTCALIAQVCTDCPSWILYFDPRALPDDSLGAAGFHALGFPFLFHRTWGQPAWFAPLRVLVRSNATLSGLSCSCARNITVEGRGCRVVCVVRCASIRSRNRRSLSPISFHPIHTNSISASPTIFNQQITQHHFLHDTTPSAHHVFLNRLALRQSPQL